MRKIALQLIIHSAVHSSIVALLGVRSGEILVVTTFHSVIAAQIDGYVIKKIDCMPSSGSGTSATDYLLRRLELTGRFLPEPIGGGDRLRF